MSVFQVRLVRNVGSAVATDPGFVPYTSVGGGSPQKSIYVNGPNLSNRKLMDGEVFTSTNYWLNFAPVSEGGLAPEETAFIHVVSNDGTVYSTKDKSLNKTARVWKPGTAGLVGKNTTFTDTNNSLNVVTTYGGVATAMQIVTDHDIKVRLNTTSGSIADLDVKGSTGGVVFENGDLPISYLAIAGTGSSGSDATVEVLLTISVTSPD